MTNATLPVPDAATDITYADPLKKISINGESTLNDWSTPKSGDRETH